MKGHGFETKSVRMERLLKMSVIAPEEDVDRIMKHVCQLAPLTRGDRYDSNAYQSAPALSSTGHSKVPQQGRNRKYASGPGVVEVSFDLPDSQELLEQVVEATFQVHRYREPVIKVQPVMVSRSMVLDDRDNPYRWWNTTGDWKKKQAH